MGTIQAKRSDAPGGYPLGAEPFIASIVADPTDDTSRLVFADWLDERGDAERAEFVRAQIELHRRHPEYGNERVRRTAFRPEDEALYERQRVLLARNKATWLVGYPRWAVSSLWQSFRRGFPTAVTASSTQWLESGALLRSWTPIETVSLQRGVKGNAEALAGASLLGLTGLSLNWVGIDELRALAGSRVLETVADLALFGGSRAVEIPALRAALGALPFGAVRDLRVGFDRAGDALDFALGESPHLRNLRVLELWGAMHEGAARDLFDSPNLANVTHLNVPHNPFGDDAIRGLVRSKYPTRLVKLRLSNTALTAEAGRLLADWPGLRTIVDLDLGANQLGLEGVRALSESAHLGALRRLSLRGNVPFRQSAVLRAIPGFAHIPDTGFDC